MAQSKKSTGANDSIVNAGHIHEAQKTMLTIGTARMLARTRKIEPELGDFIEAGAKEIVALAFMDSEMPRPVAELLRERIEALAIGVFGSHYLAVYDVYKDFFAGESAIELDVHNSTSPAAGAEGGSDAPTE